MKLLNNPELRRYVWRHFSQLHLLLPPLLVLLYCLLWGSSPSSRLFDGNTFVALFSIMAAGIALVLPGAGRALTDEMSQKTWDFQRMSSLSPLDMLIGKLLGSTLYGWYVVGCIFVGFLILKGDLLRIDQLTTILTAAFALLCGSVASLTLGLFLSREKESQRIGNSTAIMGGALLGGYIFSLLSAATSDMFGINLAASVKWYVLELTHFGALFALTVFYTGWLMVSGWYAMRRHLRYSTGINEWVLFLIMHSIVLAGFAVNVPNLNSSVVLFIAATCFFVSILSLFMEGASSERYRRMIVLYNRGDLRSFMHAIPKWSIGFTYTLLLLAFVSFLPAQSGSNLSHNIPRFYAFEGSSSYLLLNAILFILRDFVLYHAFVMDRPGRKPFVTFMVMLWFYYMMVLPMLPVYLNPFGGKVWLSYLLTVMPTNNGTIGSMLQLFVVSALCYPIIKRKIAPPPSEANS